MQMRIEWRKEEEGGWRDKRKGAERKERRGEEKGRKRREAGEMSGKVQRGKKERRGNGKE